MGTWGRPARPGKIAGECTAADAPEREDMPQGEELELKQILATMQQSLAQIDSKIDSLSFGLDRMTKRLDKHVERLDQSDMRISDIEDGQLTMSSTQAKMNKELMALQAKVDGQIPQE
ncbi:hypothetical protein NDU88_006471 [Pleurodeles waltl]|uniref:t-SNARE coiled-coil homology domain-containing protein n=1 Tax=Pleurodeles waltl TaxID=8319 RepID=A0AAV7N0I0_PLEWA|nr:hypothetical protein NDU88_006471 [Pleurodeles waltl]